MFSFLGNYSYNFPEPIQLKKKLKDYLEDNVDEKYYINNEKADKLIKQLIDNGTLPNTIPSRAEQSRAEQSRAEQSRSEQTCVDGTICEPKRREVANCIKARYDAGISNLQSDGNCVVEQYKNRQKN